MLTLALFLALSAKPPVVCLTITGPQCDYTYQTLSQAEAEAPANSMLLTTPRGSVLPLKFVADEIRRQRQVMLEMRKSFNERKRAWERENRPARLRPI
jgi:hypothetical protein